jgi:hypothetical protein
VGPGRRRPLDDQKTFRCGAGALATAGDLVFYGTMDGWFKAVDAKSGKLLWQFKTDPASSASPSPIAGPTARVRRRPVGRGRLGGCRRLDDIDVRDGSAAEAFANAMARPAVAYDAREACSMCSRFP